MTNKDLQEWLQTQPNDCKVRAKVKTKSGSKFIELSLSDFYGVHIFFDGDWIQIDVNLAKKL